MKQKIKFVKRFMSVVVAAVMVFATVAGIGNFFPNIKSEAATRQTLYICDIKSGGFSANYAGYTRLSIDGNAGNVNRGCGKGSDEYIWVKTTTDPAQAYTRIWSVWQNNSGTSSSLDGYSVERKTGDLNDGVGSKSGYIYIYATKDRNAGDPISSLGIWNDTDKKLQYAGGNSGSSLKSQNAERVENVDSNWNKIDGDLNKNAGGAYIYLYCKRAPYVIPNDIRITFDGEYHRGYVESKTSGVSISYDNTGMYQVGSNTTKYAVSKSGMETAYGTFTNTITDPYGYDKYTKLEDGLWLGVKNTAETATKDDYSYSETDGLTIKSDKQMILFGTKSGKVMKGQIKAAGDIDVNLAIRSLTITRNTQGAAITVNPAEGKTVTITAYGTNNLTSSGAYAAIQKNGSGKLVLTSTTKGTINATAGNNATYGAAGIGGGTDKTLKVVSNIEINGNVIIKARGSQPSNESYAAYGAAGIGSQYNMPVDGIRISENADVTAIGANGAAGIGSGANADAANIEIAGGIVNATAGSGTIGSKNIGGAGIGSGAYINDEAKLASGITISGGTVIATGGDGGAGIGSGSDVEATEIKVTGGVVKKATGGTDAAGVGSGANAKVSDIMISGGTVTAVGGANGAGIGSGLAGAASDIYISGNVAVTVTAGTDGAGIGSGKNASVDNINIYLEYAGNLSVDGTENGAGIGSGATDTVSEATNINISNTGFISIRARGNGAGIGAGLNSETRDINIIGEVVETKGKLIVIAANGPAIGAYAGDVKNVNVLTDATVNLSAENGIAVGALNGSSASDITIIGDNICGAKAEDVPVLGTVSNSVLFVGKTYEVYGTATIRKSTHIKAGTTLELPSSSKLIIPKDVELVVDPQHDDVLPGALVWAADSDAQLIINGTLTVKGTMAMDSEYGIIVLNGSLNLEENANIYGKFFMNGKYTGNGVITKGKNQTPEEGEIAVYLELDIDDGVTYNAKGNLAENQLIIDESSLEDTATGTYAINNIVAHDGFQITDILLDGKSIINDSSYVTKNQETGEYNVVLSVSEYRGETIKFAVKAKSTVESISIERFPNKTAFAKGAEFDLNGLKVVKTYKNKKTAPVDIDKELKVTGYDMNSVSAQTVTLQYIADDRYSDDITASYEITVFDFAGLNKGKTTLTAGGESFVATDVDNAEHVVKFALGKNVGDISALKDKIRLQVQGFTNSVGQIDFVSSEVVGQNAVEATYVADIYVDKAKTVVIQYTIVITQPTLYYDLAEAAVAVNGEYTYDGTQQTPDKENIEVTIDGAVVPDDQYTVEYGENVNAGTGRLTIKGDGIHTTNSKEATFTIAKAKLTDIDALVRSNEFTVQNDVKHELQIEFGEIEGLAADEYTVSYKKISDQSNIVANVSNGVITTAYDTSYSKAGTAEIAVNVTIKDSAVNYYADSELSHSINVTLTKYVKGTSITITSDSDDFAWDASAGEYKVTLYKGEKIWIDAKLNDGSTDVIDYKVAEGGEEIAACDGITISALGKGSAIITASTGKGATTKRIAVTVLPTTRLELTGTETYEKVFGDSAFTLDVALKDTALESKLSALRYVSADPEVAAVDETGKVTITGCGETTITVTSYTEERAYTSDEYVVIIKVKAPHTKHIKDNGTRVEPTCEKNGSITYRCTECNEVIDTEELKATGHTWDKGKVTTQPTTKTEGVKTYTCSVCKKTRTEPIAKLQEPTPEKPTPVKPTPEKPIVKLIKKGDVVSDDSKAAKVQVISTSKKTVAYKAPVNKKAKTVSIPATVKIRGKKYKVTQIAEGAFKNNKKVTKVTIGSNVSKISKNAFNGAIKLKTVTMGQNVTEIGANAFKGCKKLKTVKLGKNVKSVGKSAFYGCKKLSSVSLDAKLTKIGDKAFAKCTAIKKLTIPKKVSRIGSKAFYGCKKLKTITVKSSKLKKKTVGKSAFTQINKKATIKVPKKKVKAYKTIFKSAGAAKSVKIKK